MFRKETRKYKMCCINIHLDTNPSTFNKLTNSAHTNYCTRLLHTNRIKRFTIKCLRHTFYGTVDFFAHTHNASQS